MQTEREKYINSVNLNINTDFPYLAIDVVDDRSYPVNPGFQVMHWHEDLQFIYVEEGSAEVLTLDDSVRAQAGEGIFINKAVVHDVKWYGNCHCTGFIFPPYFLEFYAGSPAKAFVESITSNEQLPLLRFTPSVNWQKDVIDILKQLVELKRNKNEFYVYEVLVRLSTLWLIMRKNIAIPPERKESPVNIRMQKILRYIEEHYAEDITLSDLAESANISKSECSRCFRLSLDTTPYKYLTEFRLAKAAQLLRNTDEPIGNIAAGVGFHQMSHFGKCFREKTGSSPKEYRKMEKGIKSL
ncbi:MAG: AraC family transcriptional regulator [Bacillota bacterium]|nr:AraC family transcriptional regulator [Bacillota bacterium]